MKEYTSQSPNTPPPTPPETPLPDVSQPRIDHLVTELMTEATAYRVASGKTQRELGAILGISPYTVSSQENTRKQPNLHTFMRYITALGGELTLTFPELPEDADSSKDNE